METMVATLSSDGGSGQVIMEPGPLDPGRTRGFAKSRGDGQKLRLDLQLCGWVSRFKRASVV